MHTLSQGAGLVRTDVGNSAEGFERVELADDDVTLDHGARSSGESDREDDLFDKQPRVRSS